MRLVKLFAMLSGLSGTDRFTNAKLIHRESVLEHVGGVVLTCYFLVSEMNARDYDCVDMGEVLSKAAIHDVEELLMGDTPRVTKYSTVQIRELFRQVETWAVRRIVEEIEL